MDFKIKQETLQEVVNYLATRPLGEVLKMWNEIQACQPLGDAGKDEKKVEVVAD